jgi:hypothetical protein
MALSQRHRHELSQPLHKIANLFLSTFHEQCPTGKQHQTWYLPKLKLILTPTQWTMECSIQENSMPIAHLSVRDIIDDGFGLE